MTGAVDGGSLCHISILRNSNVALSILRNGHAALSNLRNCHVTILQKPMLHVTKPQNGPCCCVDFRQGSQGDWKTWKMVMEKSWNMKNWPKVMEFCDQS